MSLRIGKKLSTVFFFYIIKHERLEIMSSDCDETVNQDFILGV